MIRILRMLPKQYLLTLLVAFPWVSPYLEPELQLPSLLTWSAVMVAFFLWIGKSGFHSPWMPKAEPPSTGIVVELEQQGTSRDRKATGLASTWWLDRKGGNSEPDSTELLSILAERVIRQHLEEFVSQSELANLKQEPERALQAQAPIDAELRRFGLTVIHASIDRVGPTPDRGEPTPLPEVPR